MRVGGSHGTEKVRVRRAYEEPEPDDGTRVLVDRLWPRGLSKARAALDEWCKNVAPSGELRTWYNHDPDRFEEFSRRYRQELHDPERAEALAHLRGLAGEGPLTLLTATKRPEISEAAVLAAIAADPAGIPAQPVPVVEQRVGGLPGHIGPPPAHVVHAPGQLDRQPAPGLGAAEDDVEQRGVAGAEHRQHRARGRADLGDDRRAFQVDGHDGGHGVQELENLREPAGLEVERAGVEERLEAARPPLVRRRQPQHREVGLGGVGHHVGVGGGDGRVHALDEEPGAARGRQAAVPIGQDGDGGALRPSPGRPEVGLPRGPVGQFRVDVAAVVEQPEPELLASAAAAPTGPAGRPGS